MKNNLEEQMKKIGGLKQYLPKNLDKELEQILMYGEKYRQEGENMKSTFWTKYDRNNFVSLIMHYEDSEKLFFDGLCGEEQKFIGSLKGRNKKKFIDKYLHDRIFYSGCLKDLGEYPGVEYTSGAIFGVDYAKHLAIEWKKELIKGAYIYLEDTEISLQCLDIIAKERKDSLKPGMRITFKKCNIEDRGAQILAKEWGDNLQLGMLLNLSENHIGVEGAEALAKMELKEGMLLNLFGNEIGDDGAEVIAKNMKLKEGVTLNLSNNQIGDKGAEAIMNNMELKEGMVLYLGGENVISGEMRQKMKEWENDYRNKGIHCTVSFDKSPKQIDPFLA